MSWRGLGCLCEGEGIEGFPGVREEIQDVGLEA